MHGELCGHLWCDPRRGLLSCGAEVPHCAIGGRGRRHPAIDAADMSMVPTCTAQAQPGLLRRHSPRKERNLHLPRSGSVNKLRSCQKFRDRGSQNQEPRLRDCKVGSRGARRSAKPGSRGPRRRAPGVSGPRLRALGTSAPGRLRKINLPGRS